MRQPVVLRNFCDENDNPSGGEVSGTGLEIKWQNGPLKVDGVPQEPNGCFVETVIHACIERLRFFQNSKFNCLHNEAAIKSLEAALISLEIRTVDREKRGVEGTHGV